MQLDELARLNRIIEEMLFLSRAEARAITLSGENIKDGNELCRSIGPIQVGFSLPSEFPGRLPLAGSTLQQEAG